MTNDDKLGQCKIISSHANPHSFQYNDCYLIVSERSESKGLKLIS